jgi:hypothetical protein
MIVWIPKRTQKSTAAANEGSYAQYALQADGSSTWPFFPGTAVVHFAAPEEVVVRETTQPAGSVGVADVAILQDN